MNFQSIGTIFTLAFFSCLALNECVYEDAIKIDSNSIRIGYEHQSRSVFKFSQTIDISIFHGVKPENCTKNWRKTLCRKWGDFAKFQVTKHDDNCDDYEMKTDFNDSLSVVFDITDLHLYGAGEAENQSWPIETLKLYDDPFVSKEKNSQAVLEPMWFTSTGSFVHVSDAVPLFVTIDAKGLNLTASRRDPYIRGRNTLLKYRVCNYDNVRIAYEHAIEDIFGKPSGVPDFLMVQLPIWSTWAKYKANINESTVLNFTDLISQYKFPNSQVEIDDMWETCYGSLTVDTGRFNNMKDLVSRLKSRGFRVTIWVHPFINLDCVEYFNYAKDKGYLVKNRKNTVVTPWWNGIASYLDFTNREAAEWFVTRLHNLKAQTGIDSYKFDAGESSWSPSVPVYHIMSDDHPDTILKSYVNTVAIFGDMIEVRVGRGTQRHAIFVRMLDRETVWTGRLGIETIIPELLHMNLIGYPFVMPDMIGGNGYANHNLTKEMFIRWLQVVTFMPVLQFSFPPWDFGEETINVTKKFIDLHSSYAPKIYDLMKQSTKKPIPVNPPIWWLDPVDPVALTIKSEYLLGEDILVAPVIEEGARSRDIYLPKGTWRDENNPDAKLINGPIWLKNYPASLDVLPYFSRVSSDASLLLPSTLLIATVVLLFTLHL